jgi:hypothetical protein
MSAPACPDCGAAMQNILGRWRCPWASSERWEQWRSAPIVTCDRPLGRPRRILGLPDDMEIRR